MFVPRPDGDGTEVARIEKEPLATGGALRSLLDVLGDLLPSKTGDGNKVACQDSLNIRSWWNCLQTLWIFKFILRINEHICHFLKTVFSEIAKVIYHATAGVH